MRVEEAPKTVCSLSSILGASAQFQRSDERQKRPRHSTIFSLCLEESREMGNMEFGVCVCIIQV